MKQFNDQIKFVVFCIGLGVSLVVYAHANFSTVKDFERIENKVEEKASDTDIERIENKIDKLIFHLIKD